MSPSGTAASANQRRLSSKWSLPTQSNQRATGLHCLADCSILAAPFQNERLLPRIMEESIYMTPESSLREYINSEFTKRFGCCCGIETMPLIHEIFVKIRVREISASIMEFVRTLEAECAEFDRHISICLKAQKR